MPPEWDNWDRRMDGKLGAVWNPYGKVVFIRDLDLQKHVGLFQPEPIRGRPQAPQLAMLLDPPNDIWVLELVVVANKYAIARPTRVAALP